MASRHLISSTGDVHVLHAPSPPPPSVAGSRIYSVLGEFWFGLLFPAATEPTHLPWRTSTSSLAALGQRSSSITRTPSWRAFTMGLSLHPLLSWFPVRYELWPV
jgi:hypothetical protein